MCDGWGVVMSLPMTPLRRARGLFDEWAWFQAGCREEDLRWSDEAGRYEDREVEALWLAFSAGVSRSGAKSMLEALRCVRDEVPLERDCLAERSLYAGLFMGGRELELRGPKEKS